MNDWVIIDELINTKTILNLINQLKSQDLSIMKKMTIKIKMKMIMIAKLLQV